MTALRSLLPILALSSSALVTGACTDDPADSPDVVGTWRQIVHASDDPVAEPDRDRMAFTADGSLTMTINGTPQTAPYSLDGANLTYMYMEPDETFTVTQPIRVANGKLLLGTAEPVGAVDGAVGHWHLGGKVGTYTLDRDIVLAADGTATLDEVDPRTGQPSHYTGTWVTSAPDQYEILIMPEPNFTVRLDLFALDGVLGGALFEKI